jgi:hypothetical protein
MGIGVIGAGILSAAPVGAASASHFIFIETNMRQLLVVF